VKYAEFETRYSEVRRDLDLLLADLVNRLRGALEELNEQRAKRGLPKEFFRIKLNDFRVKECSALYKKINADSKLQIDQAFNPGHVRDLLGARIVCYNLCDVRSLVESLKKGTFAGLDYAEPPAGEKNWIDRPQEPSGYRAWHGDVKWYIHGKPYWAELQIRTYLQDAWATFVHDDLYKGFLGALPEELASRPRDMSDLLYSVDQVADRFRAQLVSAKIPGQDRIRTLEAVSNAMYALTAFAQEPQNYAEVVRNDRYVVSDTALFDFTIQSTCRRKARFRFAMGGDTENTNCKNVELYRLDAEGRETRVPGSQFTVQRQVRPNRGVTVLSREPASTLHHYRVTCEWNGVFDRVVEYLWCPWVTCYQGAVLSSYTLRIDFDEEPTNAPRLFPITRYKGIDDMLTQYLAGNGDALTKLFRSGKISYEIEYKPLEDDLLCFFVR